MQRVRVWALLVAALAGAAAAQLGCWSRAEVELERRLADLRAQGVLPSRGEADSPIPSEEGRRLASALRMLDKWLFEHAREQVSAGAPWSWRPEHRQRLAVALEPAEPFFRRADGLLSGADAARVRELDEDVGGAIEVPAHRRAWVRLLCARAVLDGGRQGGSADAAHRLGGALDVARLLGERTSWGLLTRQSLEALALGALQQVLRENAIDAPILRSAIEPHLRAASEIARLDAALTGDLRLWEERRLPAPAGATWTALLTRPGELERQASTLRSFECARVLALLPEREYERWPRDGRGLPLVESGASDGHDASWTAVVEAWRAHQSALALARLALAIVEWRQLHGAWPEDLDPLRGAFEGGVPLDPCSARPIAWSAAKARLGPTAFGARSAGSQAREELQLHLWTLEASTGAVAGQFRPVRRAR
ncbi:MAG TPA: hypothetical protein VMS76_01125 [Planctomycetota bacterium]|nr:hypothetical protein [Planctomycetota bacterium]HVS08444.1 hypothetical protein [Planctomycetota bacterium]